MQATKLSDVFESSIKDFSPEDKKILKTPIDQLSPEIVLKLETLFQSENSLDEAYMNIGATLGQAAWGKDALKEGKKLFSKYKKKLQKQLCHYPPLRLFCENQNVTDGLSVAAMIAGGLLQSMTFNIDVVSASLILSKMGIRNFCQVEWQTPSNG